MFSISHICIKKLSIYIFQAQNDFSAIFANTPNLKSTKYIDVILHSMIDVYEAYQFFFLFLSVLF